MAQTITIAMLEKVAAGINRDLGLPVERYTRNADGTHTYNGGYYIDQAYGGVKLTCNESSVFNMGFISKRQCFDMAHAFWAGIRVAQNAAAVKMEKARKQAYAIDGKAKRKDKRPAELERLRANTKDG